MCIGSSYRIAVSIPTLFNRYEHLRFFSLTKNRFVIVSQIRDFFNVFGIILEHFQKKKKKHAERNPYAVVT